MASSFLSNDQPPVFEIKSIAPPMEQVSDLWVDSLMQTLTVREKISQLLMLAVYSNKDKKYEDEIVQTVENYQIGGIIFMQGGTIRQALLNNRLQAVSHVPLMVGIDGEWGLGMRLDSTISFPRGMQLGALSKDQLVYDLGDEIARECKRLGIHINFAPVIDVNVNPQNPVINSRSFGEDKRNVTRKGFAYMMGMQSNGILAVGKHFPGHGDTSTDSHQTLPVLNQSANRLNDVELYPFKNLINNGIGGIMVAHLSVPALDKLPGRPASLSPMIIDSLLKSVMNFKGLIFTDALNMKGVTRDFLPGEIEVDAILAGNDVLLFPENIELAIENINDAVNSGRIPMQTIDERCRKILKAKKWFQLDLYIPVDTTNIIRDLNTPEARFLNRSIIEQSLTLVRNQNDFIPLKELDNQRILSISLGTSQASDLNNYLNRYTRVDTLAYSNEELLEKQNQILDTASHYNLIIINQLQTSLSPYQHYGIDSKAIGLTDLLAQKQNVILAFMGNPYGLANYRQLDRMKAIIVGYEDNTIARDLMAQGIFGGIPFAGKLPVSINQQFKEGQGVQIKKPIRLKFTTPLEFGLNDSVFYQVDSIVDSAMALKAIPGCQVLFAKEGKIIYNKSLGYYTYDAKQPVKPDDIYDLASLTKIVATTVSLMKLYEKKKIDPSAKLSKYLTELKRTDKDRLRINEIMAHQAGLHAWIPFYKNTLTPDGELRSDLYSNDSTGLFSIKLTDSLFLRSDYVDSVYQSILDTTIYQEKKYRYSDLGFYWFAKLIKQISGEPIDRFADENFYGPLGMNNTAYYPLKHFSLSRIVPTEKDNIFRKTVIRGYVNDQGAALLGGVSGHAGLFSNANDLAKYAQMLLNGGQYGGDRYFKERTVKLFTRTYFKRTQNRRALGFDKPALKPDEPGPTCPSASVESYGHSGFTGTYLWIDPASQSIYIFLSNRSYPDQSNNKLVDLNIRTEIQQVFYDVFEQ